MEDQLRLESYYEGVLHRAALHLIDQYQAVEMTYPELEKALFPRSFQISIQDQIDIILALPYNFPDDFPTVIVPEPYFSKLYPIPHLSKSKVLCTFDNEVAHPNIDDPHGVIDAVIDKAFSLIVEGQKKQNSEDYLDEFESYWMQDSSNEMLSLIKITEEAKEIHIITYQHPNWDTTTLVADSRLEGEKWLLQGGAKINDGIKKALYLPLKSIGMPPYPKTNNEILKRLRTESPEAVKPFIDFLNINGRPSTIVFSIPYGDGYLLGSWEHSKAQQYKSSAYKGKGNFQKSIKGFRPGRSNAVLELQRDYRDLSIKKQVLNRVDKERLFNRGGVGLKPESQRIGIIGCGSIGSHIARSLIDFGNHKLLLVDNDKLTFENIARHLCGASDVGKYKVDAINQQLDSHLPHCEITVYRNDVLKVLCDYESLLNRCDFSVVAIGHLPTELRLDQLQKEGVIDKPLLYVWVEPYLAGAHAVYVDAQNVGCFHDLFDEQHIFKQSVLAEPGKFSKREAGCQSTYVPYGILEVKRFLSELTFFIQDINSGLIKENILFTWLGDLQLQRNSGRKISGRWAVAENYSTRKYPLGNFISHEDVNA
ncbi:ThiF family adenylyltransferase [Paenibacillus sp. UMB4589-SE434]|uniref:ThiF family adenylyltransferase n=1 Tax=Paenibacillus sp. UMB4589-SE434 TaxID=3046314 RepID=UPI00254A06A9|nr:ThiF family adenylyltransferase [Paenibacillus sp. UMB4589-SE434]MDK8181708.1 ThiF family adenylyltransferase [Paenibacillus sp. UMB4589-SE434]